MFYDVDIEASAYVHSSHYAIKQTSRRQRFLEINVEDKVADLLQIAEYLPRTTLQPARGERIKTEDGLLDGEL